MRTRRPAGLLAVPLLVATALALAAAPAAGQAEERPGTSGHRQNHECQHGRYLHGWLADIGQPATPEVTRRECPERSP